MLVIIPTRNRSTLAMRSVESVLRQTSLDSRVKLLVSDNSTDPAEQESIRNFCEKAGVTYIRPPQPMPMSKHWNWAINYALDHIDFVSLTILTDRMLYRENAVSMLLTLTQMHPTKIVSFNHDNLEDASSPIILHKMAGSKTLIEIPSRNLLSLVAKLCNHACLPRLLNCLVPRQLLEKMRAKAPLFSSISPDFFFCFHCLRSESSILYYDDSLLLQYAMNRSNGRAFSMGKRNKDHQNFMSLLNRPAEEIFHTTPAPRLMTISNAIIHEYLLAGQGSHAPFPPVSLKRYYRRAAVDIARISNPEVQKQMKAVLAEHGHGKLDMLIHRTRHIMKQCIQRPDLGIQRFHAKFDPTRQFSDLESALKEGVIEKTMPQRWDWQLSELRPWKKLPLQQ